MNTRCVYIWKYISEFILYSTYSTYIFYIQWADSIYLSIWFAGSDQGTGQRCTSALKWSIMRWKVGEIQSVWEMMVMSLLIPWNVPFVSTLAQRNTRPILPSPLPSLQPARQQLCIISKCILFWQLSEKPRPCLRVLVFALALLRLTRFLLHRVTALKRSWQFCAWVFRHTSQCGIPQST